MSNSIKISIICATKNSGYCLNDLLESIAQFDNDNIEVIIQDGLSTDNTCEIVQRWSNLNIEWESVADEGIYDALNKAIQRSKGDWLYFIGSDDRLLPDFMPFVDSLDNEYFVYYSNVLFKEQKCFGKRCIYDILKLGIPHQATIYSRKVFTKYQYAIKFTIAADKVLNLQLVGDNAFNFKYKDYTIAYFSDQGISSSTVDNLYMDQFAELVKKHTNMWWYFRIKFNLLKKKYL